MNNSFFNAILLLFVLFECNCTSQDEMIYLQNGFILYQQNNYEEAVKEFDRVIEINPNFPQAYFFRAYTKYKIGKLSMAIQDFEKIVELDSNFFQTYNDYWLENINGEKHKIELKFFEQMRKFDQDIHLNKIYSQYYMDKVNESLYLKDNKAVIENCNMAIKLDPIQHYLYSVRAEAKMRLGNKIGACQDWNKAKELGCSIEDNILESYCN